MGFRTALFIFDLNTLFQDGTKPGSSWGNSTEVHSVSYSSMLEKLVMEKDKKFVAFAEEVRNYSCSSSINSSFFVAAYPHKHSLSKILVQFILFKMMTPGDAPVLSLG